MLHPWSGLLPRVPLGAGLIISVAAVIAACETPSADAKPAAAQESAPQTQPATATQTPVQVATEIATPTPALPSEAPATQQPVATPASEAPSEPGVQPAVAEPAGAPTPTAPAAGGAELFNEIAKVLQHPRCMNCHVSGKSPKQGDDRRTHMPPVERGADGRGVGLTCKTCHTDRNGPVAPGAPDWHLAPAAMAWEGLSIGELCRALTDAAKNGGRDGKALAKHMSEDPLVLWGWNPGGARKPVPMPQAEFAKLVHAWAEAGAGCP